MTSALTIRDLIKDYSGPEGERVRALELPVLDLPANTELAIAGPSGSGKTTLFNIVAGLLTPSSGDVLVLGEAIAKLPEAARDRFRARHIGYVFQTNNLLPGFSALENVLLAMGFADTVAPNERRARAQQLLARVGLSDRLHYRPAKLSSGQQQRVAVARALANRPALVLADEPTAHVDARNGALIAALLREACAEQGAALLLASHDPALLSSFAQVLRIGQGEEEEQARLLKPAQAGFVTDSCGL